MDAATLVCIGAQGARIAAAAPAEDSTAVQGWTWCAQIRGMLVSPPLMLCSANGASGSAMCPAHLTHDAGVQHGMHGI